MSEENKKPNEEHGTNEAPMQQPDVQSAAQPNKKPAPLSLSDISKGTLELALPIRARSKDITKLRYDFTKLTGWEYAEAMDSDVAARSVFVVTKKQAISLFAAAAAKATPDVDAIDIKQRIGVADAQRAVQVATLFLTRAAQEAGRNIYGE